MSTFRRITCTIALCSYVVASSTSAFAKIEAVQGKEYKLSPKHGPWMIMVASFNDVPAERRKEGLTALQAANQLVYELRKMGVPAYTFHQNQLLGQLEAESGNNPNKKFIARRDQIAVLAGNFEQADDPQAQKIMAYLKNGFEPQFLKDGRNGGIIPKTPGRPTALSRAQMTINPLRSIDDLKRNTVDPLVKRLNADMQYSLLKNKGKYTLRVATFEGTSSIVQVGNQQPVEAKNFFEKMMGDTLDESGKKAWELTEVLRAARKIGYERDFEAYVLHERYKSIVTIGSFDSRSDPRIGELIRRFAGKPRMHDGKEVMTAEVFTIPANVPAGRSPDKYWMFDAKPRLMEVPGR